MSLPLSLRATELTALRDVIRAALPLPSEPDGVHVFDGPDSTRAFAPRAVTIAEPFQEDQEGVSTERAERGAAARITETITVAGSVYAGGGSVGLEAHRTTAGAILQAIDDALRADRTLGGNVGLARLGSASWIQGRDDKGAGVMIGFTIVMVSLP